MSLTVNCSGAIDGARILRVNVLAASAGVAYNRSCEKKAMRAGTGSRRLVQHWTGARPFMPEPSGGWPEGLWDVPMSGLASPGRASVGSWLMGANCQLFAYGFLSLFGLSCPVLASSRLWQDRRVTMVVREPLPVDLVLFGGDEGAWGAHLAVWMAPDEMFTPL